MSTLLCLLSDQRMQNVIPLFQRGLHFDRVVFLASADEQGRLNSRFQMIFENLKQGLGTRAEYFLYPVPVDPMSPSSVHEICQTVIHEYGGPQNVTINFTSGTKPMSIGAYLAGQTEGAPMLYVDTEYEQIYSHQGEMLYCKPFDLEPISVFQGLGVHGRPVNEAETLKNALSEAEIRLANLILDHRSEGLQHLPAIHELMVKAQGKAQGNPGEYRVPWDALPPLDWLYTAMQNDNTGFIHRDGNEAIFNNPAFRFLNGRWLEAYVYLALLRDGRFMDVRSQVVVEGVPNELDVACTLNGKLGIIECKAATLYKEKRPDGKKKKSPGNDFLNRLKALQATLTGTFGKSFLVTMESKLGNPLQKRALEYKTSVIGIERLTRIEDVIYTEMARKSRMI
jgi:hypothetical protein